MLKKTQCLVVHTRDSNDDIESEEKNFSLIYTKQTETNLNTYL